MLTIVTLQPPRSVRAPERPTAFPVVYHHEDLNIPKYEEVVMVLAAGRVNG